MRPWRRAAALLLLLAGLTAYMFSQARRMPQVRSVSIALPDYPPGARPVRVVFLTDTHMAGPDQSPARLERIVARINVHKPDLVLLGGDYIGEPKLWGRAYSLEQTVSAFSRFRAPLGVVAVLGNHDYWNDAAAVEAALRAAGVTVLRNSAVRRGPLVLGGIDDAYTGQADAQAVFRAMRPHKGAHVLLSHSPDIFPKLPPGSPPLLVGHTHCGQIQVPLMGPAFVPSDYGTRYACGLYEEDGNQMIVSGGVGTSVVPLRLGARPDYWLISFGPQADE